MQNYLIPMITIRGTWVKTLAYRPVRREKLGDKERVVFQYVEERKLENGERLFVFFERSWLEQSGRFSLCDENRLEWVVEFPDQTEALEEFRKGENPHGS